MSWKYFKRDKMVTKQRQYELIRSPIITEKATLGTEFGQVTFRVPVDATKPEIKSTIEALFDVKVKAVNTLRQKGKVKLFRGREGRRNHTKKAVVCLEEGHSIDVTTGI